MTAAETFEVVARGVNVLLFVLSLGLLARISMTLHTILHEMRHRDGK